MTVGLKRALGRAFEDPVIGAQHCFRGILAAMSEPGTCHQLTQSVEAPDGLSLAGAQCLLTLVDAETPLWLAPSLAGAADYVRFHCNAQIVAEAAMASFAVLNGNDESPLLAAFGPGDERYPDRSATLIMQCESLSGGVTPLLSGPGIKEGRERGAPSFAPLGLRASFWTEAAANHDRYPLGLDFIFTAGDKIACLPRSTRIVIPRGEQH